MGKSSNCSLKCISIETNIELCVFDTTPLFLNLVRSLWLIGLGGEADYTVLYGDTFSTSVCLRRALVLVLALIEQDGVCFSLSDVPSIISEIMTKQNSQVLILFNWI